MEYELKLTTFQLDSLEKILLDYVDNDCERIKEKIIDDDCSPYDIKRHGNMCSDASTLLRKINDSRIVGKK